MIATLALALGPLLSPSPVPAGGLPQDPEATGPKITDTKPVVLEPVNPKPADPEPADAVAREVALRSASAELGRLAVAAMGDDGAPSRERLLRTVAPLLGPGLSDWVLEVAALEAAARAGALLSGGPADLDPALRPEVLAARIRVHDAGPDGAALAHRLAGALASPFHAVRRAALERLARALVTDPELTPFLPDLAGAEGLTDETCLLLSDVLGRGGAGSRPLAAAALTARVRVLEDEPLRALEELFDLWLDRPVSADAVGYLREQFPAGSPGRGLVEALALVASGAPPPDSAPLEPAPDVAAAIGVMRGELALPLDDWDLDERAERIARRSGSADLGRALLGLVDGGELSSRARQRCVRGAAWALTLDELLARAAALDAPDAVEVWRVVANRPGPLPAAAARPWLADPRAEVREVAAREVGRRLTVEEERALLPLVEELLDDPLAEVRSLAFTWLCEAARSPATWTALRAAFDREGDVRASGWRLTERQGRWLGQLPRGVPVPAFRDLVMELVGEAGRRDPAVVELLEPLAGDGEVAALLRRGLEDELRGIEAARGYPARLLHDARAAALATALAGVEGEAATPALVDGVRRAMWRMHGADAREDARPQLPKVTCGLLQRTAGGRRALEQLVGDDAPVRVRYEAALQLSKGDPDDLELARAVAARVLADYERVDGTLRARGLEALGRSAAADPAVARFLGRLTAPGGDPSEREFAVGVMGRRALGPPLLELIGAPLAGGVPDLMDVEAAVAAVRALADPAFPGGANLEGLLDLVEELDRRLAVGEVPELEQEALEQLRGTALVAAARVSRRAVRPGGGAEAETTLRRLAAAVMQRPAAAGPGDIERRFRGEDLGDVRFRWSAEVAAVEALPALAAAFLPTDERGTAGAPPPGDPCAVDGRLLVTLGELSRRGGASAAEAEELLERGLFAMEGEPRSRPAARDLTFGRAALGRAALGRVDGGGAEDARLWDRAALQAAVLLVDWRQGRIGRAVLEAEFGVADAGARRDPEARLAALCRVFRGRAALARGDRTSDDGAVESARAWADRARPWARLDDEAARALEALDAALRRSSR